MTQIVNTEKTYPEARRRRKRDRRLAGLKSLREIGIDNSVLKTPTDLTVEWSGDYQVLTWTSEYNIYIERSTTDETNYTYLTTVDVLLGTYTDETVDPDLEYYYRIKAVYGSFVSGITAGRGGSVKYLTTLPKKLIVSDPTFTDEMDAATNWAVSLNQGSLEVNTTQKYSGTGSLKMTSDGVNNEQIDRTGMTLNMSADSGTSLRIWCYPHTVPLTTIGAIWLLCSNTNSYWTKYFKYTLNVQLGSLVANKWNLLIPYTWAKTGTLDWSAIIWLYLNVQRMSGQTPIVSFDKLTYGAVYKPAVLITFDDAYQSVYDSAYPLLKAKNMVATTYVNSDYIDQAGRMTSAELQTLYHDGWGVANHTGNGVDMTTENDATIKAQLTACKNFLDNLGLTRDTQHIAFPGGFFNDAVLTSISEWGAKTGRNIVINQVNGCEPEMAYQIYSKSVPYTDSLATVKGYIDKAVTTKGVFVLTFHDFSVGAPAAGQWKLQDFSDLLDYIQAQGVQTLTIDEYYRLYTNKVGVNHI